MAVGAAAVFAVAAVCRAGSCIVSVCSMLGHADNTEGPPAQTDRPGTERCGS